MDETFHICQACRERVEPDAVDVVRAVELVPVRAMGEPKQWLEGMGVLFHRACFPQGSPYYRLKS
jgi:hypothetical protein